MDNLGTEYLILKLYCQRILQKALEVGDAERANKIIELMEEAQEAYKKSKNKLNTIELNRAKPNYVKLNMVEL